jgi:hypothetical protein
MKIVLPREVLLIEINRQCNFADCNARTSIGLTKQEALRYSGFKCVECERWNNDSLSENEVPDWWTKIETADQTEA